MRATLPQLPPFNWQRDYAPHWEGRNDGCLNDILFRPGPEDVLIIDNVRAPFSDHLSGKAKSDRQRYLEAHAHQCGLPLDAFAARTPLYKELRIYNDCTCNNSVFDYMCKVHG